MEPSKLNRSQLERVVLLARNDFLTRRQCTEMGDKFYDENLVPEAARRTIGEYLGNKISSLSNTQLVTVVKYIRVVITEENYETLLTQCGIRYIPTQQLQAA
ncbi:hypothetical protein BWI97_14395 [Siphonobacter sp. BAB-5405]|uniref:hypothetical protein n=1 Tax=Siphonobacter sp. BAB-5405 TaxID=1864825 RepID=UPI000C80CCB6|nr:hypothetical protein [Siphonobacter sp. BAB-5405]PMD95542.1 hypothetical protein BWI97_14395 [Siphonobacter sp. BAB-5405]